MSSGSNPSSNRPRAMFARLVESALGSRLLVIVLTLLLAGLGWHSFRRLPIDAFPDITTTQVQVIVKAPGMTPEEAKDCEAKVGKLHRRLAHHRRLSRRNPLNRRNTRPRNQTAPVVWHTS